MATAPTVGTASSGIVAPTVNSLVTQLPDAPTSLPDHNPPHHTIDHCTQVLLSFITIIPRCQLHNAHIYDNNNYLISRLSASVLT